MTQIKKVKTSEGVQFYPQTHTKAVIDDNGYTAESRLQAMQDEINNLQEGVVVVGDGMTPVPSDLTPTEGSSNWVTSGGIYSQLNIGTQNISIDLTQYNAERAWINSRNKWLTTNDSYPYYGKFIPITAGTRYLIVANASNITYCAFLPSNNVGEDSSSVVFAGNTTKISISAGEKYIGKAPLDANYLWISTQSTVDNSPESVIVYNKVSVKEFVDNIDSKPTAFNSNLPTSLVSSQGVYDCTYFTSSDLWEVTEPYGYLDAAGKKKDSSTYSSCLITMIPDAVYKVVMQTTGDSGNYMRIFKYANETYTQIAYYRGSGNTFTYTCPNDGELYVLQVNKLTSIAENPQIYKTDSVKSQTFINEKDIKDCQNNIYRNYNQIFEYGEELWENPTSGYIDANGNHNEDNNYASCLLTMIPNYTYKVTVQPTAGATHTRIFIYDEANDTYTQIRDVRAAGGEIIEFTCPNDSNTYKLQVIKNNTIVRYNPSVVCYNNSILGRVELLENKSVQKKDIRKQIKILCVGNSFTRDEISYSPFLLEDIIDADVTIGILYHPNCSLEQHYNLFISTGNDYDAYDEYTTTNGKWITTTGYNIDYALSKYQWDIITFQQWSNHSRYYNTFQPYLNDIINIILSKIDYPVKLGWILTPAYPDGYDRLGDDTRDTMFEKICSAVQDVMNETVIDFFVPIGTAIQNASKTDLVNLGDFGGMTFEGLHLQEGLPCLLAAYTFAQYIMNIVGYGNRGIYGNQIRPIQSWVTEKNIPHRHGQSTGVTDANCILAQKCASMAIKKPLIVSNMTDLGVL